MDESVVKHLEQQQVGTLKLSEAIRIGMKLYPETNDYCGCAIGAAYKFVTGRDLQEDQYATKNLRPNGTVAGHYVAARLFGVPPDIAAYVSDKHYLDGWSREQCAAYVERKGF